MSDEQNTDPRAPAQPMPQEQLDRVRHDIETHDLIDPWRDAPALLDDRDHWREMCRTGLEAYGDAHADIERLEADRDRLAAEVQRLTAVVANTTVVSVEAMRDSFAAARDYCYKHANTADDPARPHAAGHAWETAVNAVEELLGAVSPVDAPTGEAGPACVYFGDKCNSSRCPKHGGAGS